MQQTPADEHRLEVAALRGEIDRLRRDLAGALARESDLRQRAAHNSQTVDHAALVLDAVAALAERWWDRYNADATGSACIRDLRAEVHRMRTQVVSR